ncbi:hypothetical protein [Actinosynnema sp. NPDC023587]|uniref:hypothetical protein n=1 Tax=Actinosynnema sp. NPDC023587 TaxID=3154695 RepID=UPI003405FC74
MSTKRPLGRPSKGDRASARTRLPQPVRADVDVLVSAHPGLLGEVVAALAAAGLRHVNEAVFASSPSQDTVTTWTRLPRPIRNAVDELVASTRHSIGEVIAALVAVGLRHVEEAPLPARVRQGALMT